MGDGWLPGISRGTAARGLGALPEREVACYHLFAVDPRHAAGTSGALLAAAAGGARELVARVVPYQIGLGPT